jgi:hypothetical protein
MFGGTPTFSANIWSAVATATGFTLSNITIGSTYAYTFYALGTSMGNNNLACTGWTFVTSQINTNTATQTIASVTVVANAATLVIVPDTIAGTYTDLRLVFCEASPFV